MAVLLKEIDLKCLQEQIKTQKHTTCSKTDLNRKEINGEIDLMLPNYEPKEDERI